jgi:hypothetical protein
MYSIPRVLTIEDGGSRDSDEEQRLVVGLHSIVKLAPPTNQFGNHLDV